MSDIAESPSDRIAERDNRYVADAQKIRYTPFVLSHGDGARLIDVEGRSFIDFGAGWAAANLGYTNPHVQEAIAAQVQKTTFGTLVSGMHEPAAELAETLTTLVPGDFEKKAWFGLSGSDASEAAQRMILRSSRKPRIISFIGSWHGTTDSTMALSAHPSLAGAVGGAHVTKIPYPNPYRDPFGGTGEGLTDRCLAFLEDYLFTTICPPGEVAAIFAEAVQSDGGDIVPPPDFMPKLRALCDRHEILLVLDEIKVGMGRTGKWFAFEHGNIAPDLVLMGKALGGGLPLSAVVGRREILDVASGIALFTLSGNATSCAASIAAIRETSRLELLERSAMNGQLMLDRLRLELDHFDNVGDIRGKGMILGVELVDDRKSKRPVQPLAAKVVFRAWQLGLIVYYAGNWGNVLEITPPLAIDRADIDEGIAILRKSFEDVLDGAVSDADVAPFAGW